MSLPYGNGPSRSRGSSWNYIERNSRYTRQSTVSGSTIRNLFDERNHHRRENTRGTRRNWGRGGYGGQERQFSEQESSRFGEERESFSSSATLVPIYSQTCSEDLKELANEG